MSAYEITQQLIRLEEKRVHKLKKYSRDAGERSQVKKVEAIKRKDAILNV
jgi:hypothetical protein